MPAVESCLPVIHTAKWELWGEERGVLGGCSGSNVIRPGIPTKGNTAMRLCLVACACTVPEAGQGRGGRMTPLEHTAHQLTQASMQSPKLTRTELPSLSLVSAAHLFWGGRVSGV